MFFSPNMEIYSTCKSAYEEYVELNICGLPILKTRLIVVDRVDLVLRKFAVWIGLGPEEKRQCQNVSV